MNSAARHLDVDFRQLHGRFNTYGDGSFNQSQELCHVRFHHRAA